MRALPSDKGLSGGVEDTIFLSWASENGRTADLAEALGIPVYFLKRSGRGALPIRYYHQAAATLRVLRSVRPKRVVLMLPPTPLLVVCAVWARAQRDRRLIGDLHTGFFNDPKWTRFTELGLRLLRPHAAIVTNEHLREIAGAAGVESIAAHDPLSDRSSDVRPSIDAVLCPVSYANDEPIDAILEAARQTPELTWRLTGRAPSEIVSAAPENVVFTGFVSEEELVELFRNSAVVVALTLRDHTMQRAGYEALMYGRPQVTSDFGVLADFVGDAGITIEPSRADQLTRAVRTIVSDLESWEAFAASTLHLRILEQTSAFEEMRRLIFGQVDRSITGPQRKSVQ